MLTQTRPDRLRVTLERRPEDVHEPDHVSDVPLVQFVAFGRDQRMFGWVRLTADRLTDLLNAHDVLLLTDVEIEHLDERATRSADEIVIHRSELVAVRASGPRGDDARRRLTRTHAIAMRPGDDLIGGHKVALGEDGNDPIDGGAAASGANGPRANPPTSAAPPSTALVSRRRRSAAGAAGAFPCSAAPSPPRSC